MRKFDLSLRSSRSSYFATFRYQLTILSNTDALDEEKWLTLLGTLVKAWFRYEPHFVHGRDSRVDILKERGLLSESDAVQPLIGKKAWVKLLNNPYVSRPLWPLLSSFRLLPFFFFFQAEDGIRDADVTGVQTCALPICEIHERVHRRRRPLARPLVH